jgi:hypothetical protein
MKLNGSLKKASQLLIFEVMWWKKIRIISLALLAVLIVVILWVVFSTNTPHTVSNSGNKSMKARMMLEVFATSVELFEGQYNFYPPVFEVKNKDVLWVMDTLEKQQKFMKQLDGSVEIDGPRRPSTIVNRRVRKIMDFSNGEFEFSKETGRLIDSFGNEKFYFLIDGNKDGKIDRSLNPVGNYDLKAKVLVYTTSNTGEGDRGFSWDVKASSK